MSAFVAMIVIALLVLDWAYRNDTAFSGAGMDSGKAAVNLPVEGLGANAQDPSYWIT